MTLLKGAPAPSYFVEEDSDEYGAMSSDDDAGEDPLLQDDLLLRDDDEASNGSDDFEKEMDAEIRGTMAISLPEKKKEKEEKKDKFYDEVYFNSSDEEDGNEKVDKKIKTNDELFYDPTQDEKDEKWVLRKRKNYLQPGSNKKGESSKKDSSSKDPGPSSATLCCPACMTTLCRDCQQHETYTNQFRAMFVFSCLVETGETLSYKTKERKRKRRRDGEREEREEGEEELYNPVKCAVCKTKVGVFDKEEIYHFFNVLAT